MKVLNKYLLLNEGAHGSGTQTGKPGRDSQRKGQSLCCCCQRGRVGHTFKGAPDTQKGGSLWDHVFPEGQGHALSVPPSLSPMSLSSFRLPTQPVVESSCQENCIIDSLLGERTAVVQTILGSSQ